MKACLDSLILRHAVLYSFEGMQCFLSSVTYHILYHAQVLGDEVIRVKLVALNVTVVRECVESTKLGSGVIEFEKVLCNSKVPKDV